MLCLSTSKKLFVLNDIPMACKPPLSFVIPKLQFFYSIFGTLLSRLNLRSNSQKEGVGKVIEGIAEFPLRSVRTLNDVSTITSL